MHVDATYSSESIEDSSLQLPWFKCIVSSASSTMEFLRKNLDSNIGEKLRDTVFVNSNPMVDHVLGARLEKLFYKYIPVWRNHWDSKIGTVRPEVTYYVALKNLFKKAR